MKSRLYIPTLVILLVLTVSACGEIPTPPQAARPAQQATVLPTSTAAPTIPTVEVTPTTGPTETPVAAPTLTPTPQPAFEVLTFLVVEGEGRGFYETVIDGEGLHGQTMLGYAGGGGAFGMYPTADGRYVALDLPSGTDRSVLIGDIALNDIFYPIVNGGYLGNGWFVNWTPEGDMLYWANGGFGLLPVGLWRINVRQDEDHFWFDLEDPYRRVISVEASPDGSTILYSRSLGLGEGSRVWRMNADGSGRELLWSDPKNVAGLEYAPDGSRVAYVALPDTVTPFSNAELWVMDADGSNRQQIYDLADGGHGYRPRWSPDSSLIAFVSKENPATWEGRHLDEGAINNVYLADPYSPTVWPLLPLEAGQQHNFDPCWSLDGSQIVFVSDRSGSDEIWVITVPDETGANGTNLRQLTDDGLDKRYPLWMPGWASSFLPVIPNDLQGGNRLPSTRC